jgi:putative membrane protein
MTPRLSTDRRSFDVPGGASRGTSNARWRVRRRTERRIAGSISGSISGSIATVRPKVRVALGVGLAWLAAVSPVSAHGPAAPAPVLPDVLLAWSFDPTVVAPLVLAGALYALAVRRVDRAHPRSRIQPARIAAWFAGLGAIWLALQSPIERYDTTLFSVHMVQHLLLTLAAPPLLALGAPITLLLRAARPGTRRRVILPILHSWPIRALTFPVVTWLLFAGAMWGTHFSPMFNASLEEPLVHQLEHALYLVAGCLFWWPVVGLDPSPWRMSEPVRVLYTFLQMPQNSFLGLAITSATAPLYEHYATLPRDWGPSVLVDQQMAGAVMWVGGDLIFLAAVLGVVLGWMRREARETQAADARTDRARLDIRARESLLAERVARERDEG